MLEVCVLSEYLNEVLSVNKCMSFSYLKFLVI